MLITAEYIQHVGSDWAARPPVIGDRRVDKAELVTIELSQLRCLEGLSVRSSQQQRFSRSYLDTELWGGLAAEIIVAVVATRERQIDKIAASAARTYDRQTHLAIKSADLPCDISDP